MPCSEQAATVLCPGAAPAAWALQCT